jgi:diguanylate cyclase (GGDEF)-like protein
VFEEIKILVVDDDRGFCKALSDIMSEKGYSTECAHTGAEALAKINEKLFNVVLIDVNLPDINGIELFKDIKQVAPDIEGVIVTGYTSIESAVPAIRYGTINYVLKPLVADDVLKSVNDAIGRRQFLLEERQRLSEEIAEKEHYQTLATIDSLTGLYNRRYFHDFLVKEVRRADRYSYSFGVFMVDIDNFKAYQDPYGHPVGDNALQYIAQIMSRIVRSEDIVARYGGEEFSIILPEVSKDAAIIIAERLRQAVEDAKEPLKRQLTVSIGVAMYPTDAEDPKQLVNRADKALYNAKRAGKNRTMLWDPAK